MKQDTPPTSSKERKLNSLEKIKEPNIEPPKEEGKGYWVLQKTSSTITLQSVKVQTGPKTELKAATFGQEDDEKKPKQSLTANWKDALSARQGGLRTKELEDHVGFKKNITEVKREPQGISPQFECLSGKPKATVEWFKERAPVEAGDGIHLYEEDGIHCLCLKKIQLENSGSYCCTATNTQGQASTRWILTVKRPKVKDIAPHFSSVLKSCSVSEGQDFVLQCSVGGVPMPQITWLLNGKAWFS
ncbi:hypothetical protein JD844_022450 [Phrynosoma platyrhinos]|uniref:Ig-like domain-containing protein n=1 Tax=Phrynosoma platyrhinos TaxID=52577 RepID=A0ABQ7SVE4_PHRPL|nr:hypothetical protein JD844_022450 [Phrynosoma platyrhinos]